MPVNKTKFAAASETSVWIKFLKEEGIEEIFAVPERKVGIPHRGKTAAEVARVHHFRPQALRKRHPARAVLAGLFPEPQKDTLAVRIGAERRHQHAAA